MSVRLPAPSASQEPVSVFETVSNPSEDEDDDQTWDDWVSDSAQLHCFSLFEDKSFPSAAETVQYDRSTYSFDLNDVCSKLSLDFHQRIRLVNYIRSKKPTAAEANLLKGTEPFFTSDDYLIPVVEDDPLLQWSTDVWSDSDDDEIGPSHSEDPNRKTRLLERQLRKARQDLIDYRSFIAERLNAASLAEALRDDTANSVIPRDDDSHYFQSYGENDIHAVMIQDKVRTSTYASFILTTPGLFRDAIVLDVGCGTGILSLFAARAGAKRVIAVDASDIAKKAEIIVKDNGLEDIITVVSGKVETITLPDGIEQVDIIISEWMGYALLYESMLDSVLHARDRFLKPEGVMAPSQCKMMLALCEGSEIFKERVEFWGDIYGFDLSAMASGLYDDAIVDVVGPESMVSDPYTVKDLHLRDITSRQLDFSSSFTLTSKAERKIKIHALTLYFDTFFTVSGEPVPPNTEVKLIKSSDIVVAEVWPVGGKSPLQRRQSQGEGLRGRDKITSFSTGPLSIPTHWKQTIFLLREPIHAEEGTVVSGTFYCKKRSTNSRELDIEIHYSVKENAETAVTEMFVQMYTVR